MSIPVSTFLYLVLSEIRVARAGDVLAPSQQDLALSLFNEYLEALSVTPRALFNNQFDLYTLIPGHQPHTYGPGGDFDTGSRRRSTAIQHASLVLPTGSIRNPITIRDTTWWADVRNRTITTSVPTDLYYDDDWPIANLNFWPIPSLAYQVELSTLSELTSVVATDTLDLPQGYQRALRLTMAEICAPAFGQTVSPETQRAAMEARGAVWGNNDVIPNQRTRDGGMPSGTARRSSYNFRTGMV